MLILAISDRFRLMKEIKQIIQAYEEACIHKQKVALATVVHVEGSSYRSPGARMLIKEDGMLTGAISGGCLEGDALRKALMVMMQGKPLLTTYDTSDEDDAFIGVGLGCNGIIKVLIEPIKQEDDMNPVMLLKAILQNRQPSVLVTFFSMNNKWSGNQGTHLLLKENGISIQRNTTPIDFQIVLEEAKAVFEKKCPFFVQYSSSENELNNSSLTAFLEYIEPTTSLVVLGAGNDVFPLVQFAEVLGWSITLVDGRPNYASTQRFPTCQLVISEPEKALQNIVIDDKTAAVLMTHNYHYDKQVLKALSAHPITYIGMLGPKKKLDKMLEELKEEGTDLSQKLLHIYSPVGLHIGAETSEEIALSIIAEIKAVFAGKTGGYLRDLSGKIHDRQTVTVDAVINA